VTCGQKLKFGVSDDTITACDKDADHLLSSDPETARHEGPGLPEFPYQRVIWFPGDRREFAGEWTPCTRKPGCVLCELHRGNCAI
jgi:hypothetical protein